MASNIPPALKVITPFITRGKQMEKADPVISYFCQMWAVQTILTRSLHEADTESKIYATQLLDQLEQKKASLANNEAIHDDVVGQAYVETFAMKIFNNADNTQRARKCTRQTADTFLAAATFLELLKIFGEPDQEAQSKIKFAKFHAARIMKAINAGEDPNLPASPEEEKPEFIDADDTSGAPSAPPPPTVEEITDELERFESRMARTSLGGESPHPSRGVSPLPPHQQQQYQSHPPQPPPHHTPQDQRLPYQHTVDPSPPSAHRSPELSNYFPPAPPDYLRGSSTGPSVPPRPSSSAFDLPSAPPSAPASSIGGGGSFKLPSAPSGPAHSSAFDLPSSPSGAPHSANSFNLPGAPGLDLPSSPTRPPGGLNLPSAPTGSAGPFDLPNPPSNQPNDFYTSMSSAAPPPQPPPMGALQDEGAPRTAYSMSHNVHQHHHPPPVPQHMSPPPPPPHQQPVYHHHHQQPQPPPPPQDNFIDTDDSEAIAKAQKHAKFAISALNYEDIPTAVKELRLALKTLGART